MKTCLVCDGSGYVKAAPLSMLGQAGFGGRVVSRNNHRRALWNKAVRVPCWVCGGDGRGAE